MPNQTFDEMMKAAMIPLQGRQGDEIARRCGFAYDDRAGVFRFFSLGRKITLSWPDCIFDECIQDWHKLVILHYMDTAIGMQPSGMPLPFGSQSGGMVRGGGFDQDCEACIRNELGKCDENTLLNACRMLGGKIIPSNADLCAVFDFLPGYPVTLKIWFADDEMEASGRMFLDSNGQYSLSVEDSVTVGMLILEELLHLTRQEGRI